MLDLESEAAHLAHGLIHEWAAIKLVLLRLHWRYLPLVESILGACVGRNTLDLKMLHGQFLMPTYHFENDPNLAMIEARMRNTLRDREELGNPP